MTHAIRFHKAGGPEVLQWEEVQVGKPGPGEARVRNTAVGLNYVDTYIRSGLYPAALPSGLGAEGAGVVEEVGPDVTEVKPGDRVAYGTGPLGAYSEARVMPVDRLVVLPDGISDQQGAAMMLKGLTTTISDPADLQSRPGRRDPVPCRRGRRRPDRVPMGAFAGRHGDRHGRQRREGGARQGARLRSSDRLYPRGFRRARK